MAGKKAILISQLGGIFKNLDDGSFRYEAEDAHAIYINENSKYSDFNMEVAKTFYCSRNFVTIKYFLPGIKKTLITVESWK